MERFMPSMGNKALKSNKLEQGVAEKISNFDFYNIPYKHLGVKEYNNESKLEEKVAKRVDSFIESYKKTKDSFYREQRFGVSLDPSILGYFGHLPKATSALLNYVDIENEDNFEVSEEILDTVHNELHNLFIYDYNSEYKEGDKVNIFSFTGDSFTPECFEIVKNKIQEISDGKKENSSYFLSLYLKEIIATCGNTKSFNEIAKPVLLPNGQYIFIRPDGVFISNKNVAKNKIEKFAKGLIDGSEKSEYEEPYRPDFETDEDKFLKKNFTEAPIKDEYYKEYVSMMQSDFRSLVEEDLHCNLLHFSPIEQFHVLKYIKSVKNKEIEALKSFTSLYGEQGLRTFLSIEQGGKEMGSKTITLGEKLPKESADKLFEKYGEIIDEVENVAEHLEQSLGSKATPELVNMVREHLLVKGKDLLASYAKPAEICKAQECEDLGKELEIKLQDIKASLLIFAGATKALVEKGEFNFEDFKNIEIEYGTTSPEQEEKERMLKMAEENTRQYPEALRTYWLSTLKNALENPALGEIFIQVKDKGMIVAFMRVIPQGDGKVYGASFNIDPNLKGSRIGTELLREVIANYTKDGSFTADVYEKNPMLNVYIEKFGFEIKSKTENYHDTGTTIYGIEKVKQAA